MSLSLRLLLITALAMVAFAANSVFARLAMAHGDAGPWAFTTVRIVAGAVVLALIASPAKALRFGNWASAAALLTYAAAFSIAYVTLTTGTGALLLFAMVQITMIGAALYGGERLRPQRWAGLALAIAGLIWLLLPGLSAPPLTGALFMAASGIAWGIYSLRGRGTASPTEMTAGNFLRASLIMLPIGVIAIVLQGEPLPSGTGLVYALASGAITSGLGYAIWYAALRDLSASLAAISQLTVPAIAAAGGMVFLSEPLTVRFIIATALILTGVALSTLSRKPSQN